MLKDIRSERAKITEKDNLRLLYMTKWFLEFFLLMRVKEQAKRTGEETWSFGLIGEVTERSWIIWVLKRMREAVEEKVRFLSRGLALHDWDIILKSADHRLSAKTVDGAPSRH